MDESIRKLFGCDQCIFYIGNQPENVQELMSHFSTDCFLLNPCEGEKVCKLFKQHEEGQDVMNYLGLEMRPKEKWLKSLKMEGGHYDQQR